MVIGPGALGLLLGAQLVTAGRSVVFLARSAERATELNAAGLTLERDGVQTRFPLDARTAPPARAAAVLVCVKVRDTEGACELARRIPDAPVVVFQNGFGRGRAVADALGDSQRVVVALTREGATRGASPGLVLHAGRGPTQFAALELDSLGRAQQVSELFGATLESVVVEDLARIEWEKLGVNVAINALTAIARCPNGALLDVPELRELAQQAALECSACAQAAGIEGEWGPEATRNRWESVAQATATNRSSSLQDILANRATEISAINGALVKRALELGTPAPINTWLTQLVRGLEQLSPELS